MEIKLGNYKGHSFEKVMEQKGINGKFVTFQWIIPLPLFTPIKRLSRVYYIESESYSKQYAKKYNIINYLIGWWGLPFGPINLFKSVNINKNGGVDVTDDVYLNLIKHDYENGIVKIKKKSTIFVSPNKTELKEFEKVFKSLIDEKILFEFPIIGLYIDTEKNEEPYYVIGLYQEISEETKSEITKAIYKRFYKQLKFKLVFIEQMKDYRNQFLEQGLKLK